ncbi:lysogeny maintenance protein PflM [Pseudomonas sp. PDM19]|uniref:lysogeny maintenance protein PflM n=1 Tax=Pseudomonas sp. PDM19 TaxID=2769272 RepID=UPI001784422F|nr:DUF5447 family protein [Pseudomonas sp. PDM19]MBD9633612.1 DUF5447 family protein [Pseudomonas sp. PDM19]
MSVLSKYLHQLHPESCTCSVCVAHALPVEPPVVSSRYTHCTECRPTRVFTVVGTMNLVSGAWRQVSSTYRVERGFTCEKHQPGRRPPQYWHVIYDSGRPTPFVPVREPFELEG